MEKNLVDLIGSPKYEHILPNPIEGLTKIFNDLKGQKYSAILDLTGWLHPSLRSLFPNTPIVDGFSLSRVRVTSSPNMETSGYTVSMNPDEIQSIKQGLNMEKVLVTDDTTFTGWTSLKTMELWRLDPASTTHAFLIANTGMLSPENGIKGAVQELESKGSKVIWGHELKTPQDDGWHLKDLHQHENLRSSFSMGLKILKLMDEQGPNSETVLSMLQSDNVISTLFPERLSTQEINQMTEVGKFIPSGKVDLTTNGLIHTKNPLLWASRYFREHIDLQNVIEHQDEVGDILTELHTLTEDPEAGLEAARELKNIVGRNITNVENFTPGGPEM